VVIHPQQSAYRSGVAGSNSDPLRYRPSKYPLRGAISSLTFRHPLIVSLVGEVIERYATEKSHVMVPLEWDGPPTFAVLASKHSRSTSHPANFRVAGFFFAAQRAPSGLFASYNHNRQRTRPRSFCMPRGLFLLGSRLRLAFCIPQNQKNAKPLTPTFSETRGPFWSLWRVSHRLLRYQTEKAAANATKQTTQKKCMAVRCWLNLGQKAETTRYPFASLKIGVPLWSATSLCQRFTAERV
jgi:hypothetical protein